MKFYRLSINYLFISLIALAFLSMPILSLAQRYTSTDRQRMSASEYREYLQKRREELAKKGAEKAPERAAPKGSTTKKTYTKPTAKAATKRSPGSSGYKIAPIKMQADMSAAILYIEPLDVIARKGEIFETELVLSNPRAEAFNQTFIALAYDPEAVRPIGIDESQLKDLLREPTVASVYNTKGLLLYEANLKEAVNFNDKTLMSIKWKTVGEVKSSKIRFASFNNNYTSLMYDGSGILGDQATPGDGVIGATVNVLSPGQQPELLEFGTEFYDIGQELASLDVTGDIKLELRGTKSKVRVGEKFLVDIYFANPLKSQADAVNLRIRFDPEVLQVIDYDEDNWIAQGVNIHDGAYHEQFPFDYHIKNEVDNSNGVIVYQMGASRTGVLSRSGRLATIKFRAVKSSDKAFVYFVPPKRPGAPGTTVEFLGRDVLGDMADHRDGTRNLALIITSQ